MFVTLCLLPNLAWSVSSCSLAVCDTDLYPAVPYSSCIMAQVDIEDTWDSSDADDEPSFYLLDVAALIDVKSEDESGRSESSPDNVYLDEEYPDSDFEGPEDQSTPAQDLADASPSYEVEKWSEAMRDRRENETIVTSAEVA